mgnify:CR=1 FL=1
MRRIAKMPLWAESRIHGDVYVRFGGRLSETYHRKVAWRRQPSLHLTNDKVSEDMGRLQERIGNKFELTDNERAEVVIPTPQIKRTKRMKP